MAWLFFLILRFSKAKVAKEEFYSSKRAITICDVDVKTQSSQN